MADMLSMVTSQLENYSFPTTKYVARTSKSYKRHQWTLNPFSKLMTTVTSEPFTTEVASYPLKPPSDMELDPELVTLTPLQPSSRWRLMLRPLVMDGESIAISPAAQQITFNDDQVDAGSLEGEEEIDIDDTEYISLFLCLEYMGHPRRTKIEVNARLCLLTNKGRDYNSMETSAVFTQEGTCGFSKFITRNQLLDNPKGVLDENCLQVICYISVQEEIMSITSEPETNALGADEGEAVFLHLLSTFSPWSDVRVQSTPPAFQVDAHRVVLASSNEKLQALLLELEEEMTEEEAAFTGKKYNLKLLYPPIAVRGCLEYIYTGRVSGLREAAEELLPLAHFISQEELKKKCEESLASQLTLQNVSQLMKLAIDNAASMLKSKIYIFAKEREKALQNVIEWQKLIDLYPYLQELLS